MLPVKNLFVLYTGGTIGMLQTPQGLAPAGGFEARMRDHLQSLGDAPDLRWRFAELQPPLDSANMTQGNWLAMRDAIVAALDAGHDGVLLLHGTDTLAYSAAALSFLLLDLPVPVLLTGSMLPAGAPGSDAWDNLVGALRVLQEGHARGVQVYFNDALLHGARVSKLRSDAFDAFAELPRPRHAEHAPVPAALGYRQPRREVNLAVLPLYPGLRAAHLRGLLDSGVEALLLECYGSGTGPSVPGAHRQASANSVSGLPRFIPRRRVHRMSPSAAGPAGIRPQGGNTCMYAIAEDTLPARVLKELLLYRRRYPEHRQSASEADEIRRIEQVQLPRIAAFIEAGEPIEFVLPAFPAKSPNPGKVLDSRPDMAERLSLSFLNHLCQRIQLFYAPGAKITVCSDGRVFGDLVRIGDAHISAYQDALRLMIEEIGATHIGVFNLEDVRAFEAQRDNHEQLRQLLIDGYAEPLESIRETLLASEEGLLLYRAITRFLYEDGLTPDYQGSKTALQRDAKERAYGVIQRSWAWGALLADQFPRAIRLSIHPQPADSLKFGIHMMPTRDDWLTPWHGVAVNTEDRFVLMKRSEVLELGGELVQINGQPSHYRLPARAARRAAVA